MFRKLFWVLRSLHHMKLLQKERELKGRENEKEKDKEKEDATSKNTKN